MRVAVLGSGSSGNAVVVDCGGRRLLLDAGFSCRELERRLRRVGVEPQSLSGVVLTHEHEDHVRGTARFAGKHRLPVYATQGTIDGAGLRGATAAALHPLRCGVPVELGGFIVEPFAVPHDAREPVGLVVEAPGGQRLGLISDLGSRSRLAWARLQEVEFLLLETNHDLEMLRNGPYPWSLKQRIASGHGHLSNRAAAEGLPELLSDRLKWVVLYHLSRTNNLPALACAAVVEQLALAGCSAEIALSSQAEPTAWLEAGA
jgi:phosphoribosyl 1,2-cyclic phosphodiesterase